MLRCAIHGAGRLKWDELRVRPTTGTTKQGTEVTTNMILVPVRSDQKGNGQL
jgi:hypothetical protein